MPKNGFVDKNLFGLKERLNAPAGKDTEKADLNIEADEQKTTLQQSVNVTREDEQDSASVPLDKDFSRALSERKKEFIRIRSDVLTKIRKSSENLPAEIKKYENWLSEGKTIKSKLDYLVETINSINEKEWDKNNFSVELADAMKKVENARLELFTLQKKTECLDEEDTPGLEKHNSIIPELTSLSVWQLLKLGTGFFFPLIIGLLLTGIIISLAVLIAMGTI